MIIDQIIVLWRKWQFGQEGGASEDIVIGSDSESEDTM